MQNTKLRNHELITTQDGSLSAYSKTYGENFHNTTGAVSETQIHYVQGCQVLDRARKQESFSILEVGLGLGVGFEQTYEALKKLKTKIYFTSLEIDEELILHLKENNPLFKALTKSQAGYRADIDQFHLEVLLGDARETLPNSHRRFHAIYQDPFSPKRNATLWTKEWFELLGSLSEDDCIMSTYSSSSAIRKAMLAAGWKIQKGARFGPKRSSTRAFKTGESDQEILEHLKRSPAITLTDQNAKDYRL
ncbi:MAG: MnmC family methyltransferase [Bacteriovoracaceae bacterium]